MKKSELKNIIKECVKEVIFEEGILSGIITEVVQGMGVATQLVESRPSAPHHATQPTPPALAETKRQVLSAIGTNSYDSLKNKFENPELFEGTKPLPSDKGGKGGALQGLDPADPGLDITNIPGFGNWGHVVKNI